MGDRRWHTKRDTRYLTHGTAHTREKKLERRAEEGHIQLLAALRRSGAFTAT